MLCTKAKSFHWPSTTSTMTTASLLRPEWFWGVIVNTPLTPAHPEMDSMAARRSGRDAAGDRRGRRPVGRSDSGKDAADALEFDREQTERRAARVATWLASHPLAIKIDDGRWWDASSMSVLDRDNERLTPRDLRAGTVPAMRIRIRSGRAGHIWTGGSQTACRRWLGFADMEPTDAPLCAACTRIRGAP